MRYSRGRRSSPSAAALVAAILLAAGTAAEAAAPVSLDATVGIGGAGRAGSWAPIIVTVDNPGPSLAGTLGVEVQLGSGLRGTLAARAFERAVELPARSRQRFGFAVPLAPSPRPAVVRLTADGRELARLEVDLARAAGSDRLVVALSSELAFDALAREGTRVVYPHPQNLPGSWAGWSGVDLVVLRDTAFLRPSAAQVLALEQWVRAGGRLVVTGGAPALELAATGLADLLPVEVAGLVEREPPVALGRLAGAAVPRGRWTFATATPRAGAVLPAADGDLALVAVRPLGHGSVAWLAFDPADPRVAAWPGTAALWGILAGDTAAPAPPDDTPREPLEDPWIAPLAARADVSFPSHGLLAGVLAVVLLPVLWLLLAPRGPGPRPRVVLLVAAAAAGTFTAWFTLDRGRFRGGDFLLEAARVEVAGGSARLERHLAVCSPSGGAFALDLGGADGLVVDPTPVTERRPALALTVALGDTAVARGTLPGRFQSRLLVAEAVIAFPLAAAIVKEADGSWLSVENLTAATVRGAFLLSEDGVHPLGDLAAGSRARFALGDPVAGIAIDDAVRRALWEREAPLLPRSRPVLAGWLDEPPLTARLDGAPPAAAVCLVTVEVGHR